MANLGTRASTLVHGKNLGGMHYDSEISLRIVGRLVNFIYYGLQLKFIMDSNNVGTRNHLKKN